MGTVREWLEQNNLEKYAHNFEEEEFDNLDSLKYMTLDHLSTVVKPRGAQAEFLRALEKKFGTATMIHKQLMVTHENKEQKHLKAPMAEDNGLPAFLQTPIFQAIFNTLKGTASNNKAPPVETVGENSELINVESNDSPGRTGYLRSMMTYFGGRTLVLIASVPCLVTTCLLSPRLGCFGAADNDEDWITKTLKPILYSFTINRLQTKILCGYDSSADLLADIRRKLISIMQRGWRFLCANWKEVCVVILALIALTVLVLLVFGYIPVPTMLSSAFSVSPTSSSAAAQVGLDATTTSSEFNGVMQTVYGFFNYNCNMERSFVGLG